MTPLQRRPHVEARDPAVLSLAIVGAPGNIGQTCAEILAPRFGRTILLGSSKPSAHRRLTAHSQQKPLAMVAPNRLVVIAARVRLADAMRAE